MEDHHIFQIALLTTALGLAGMILLSGEILPQEFKVKNINKNQIGEEVAIDGLIRSVEIHKNNVHILSVIDGSGELKVVIFGPLADEFTRQGTDLKNFENKRAKINGIVKEYNGGMELIVDNSRSIRIVN